MDAERRRRAPQPGARDSRGGSGAGGGRPDWGQWHVDPDTLWFSPFPGHAASPSRSDRRDSQRHELVQKRAQDPRARPRLTKEEIVDAAIAIADAEGAEALSMRRIAQVLRSGTMSLYWHIASKEQLVNLMRDILMAEIEAPDPSGDWRADLRSLAVSMRAVLRRHRWLLEFMGGRPPLGPNTVLGLERSLALLAHLGLKPGMAIDILTSLNTYVTGVVLRESQEMRTQQYERELGIDEAVAEREQAAWRERLVATGLFPNFVSFLDEAIDPDALETMDQRFEFGLDCMLDGVAGRIGQ